MPGDPFTSALRSFLELEETVKRRGEIGTPMFTREPDTEEHQ